VSTNERTDRHDTRNLASGSVSFKEYKIWVGAIRLCDFSHCIQMS
jgi:hypothetical protein